MSPNKPCLPAAVKLLAIRDYSEAELRSKLGLKGYSPADIDAAVAELSRRCYLNDAALGRRLLARWHEEGLSGRLAVEQRLTARGLAPTTVAAIMADYDDTGEYDRAAAAATARFSTRAGADIAKVARFLLARGFAEEIVRLVLARLYGYDDIG